MKITKEIIDAVLNDMFNGIPVYASLRRREIKPRQFFKVVESSPILLNHLAVAQEACAEALAGEIIEIADTDNDVQRARNRIDARKWYSSKLRPSKFGDRIDLNVNQIVDISQALKEASNRVITSSTQRNPNNRSFLAENDARNFTESRHIIDAKNSHIIDAKNSHIIDAKNSHIIDAKNSQIKNDGKNIKNIKNIVEEEEK